MEGKQGDGGKEVEENSEKLEVKGNDIMEAIIS